MSRAESGCHRRCNRNTRIDISTPEVAAHMMHGNDALVGAAGPADTILQTPYEIKSGLLHIPDVRE
jgi:hypothetical protein